MDSTCRISPRLRLALTLCLAGGAGLAGAQQPAQPPPARDADAPAMRDPDALAALTKMGEALNKLDHFTLTADADTDVVLEDGQKVTLSGQAEYQVQRPNKLYMQLQSDRRLRRAYYDGSTLTVYAPRLHYYAQAETAAHTLAELADNVSSKLDIDLPLADLFYWGTPRAPVQALNSAIAVGPGKLDGEVVEQYAFRQQGVDWQIWIAQSDALPRKLVITTLGDPSRPQYVARLHWDTRSRPAAKTFAFEVPTDASRIRFVPATAMVVEPAAGETK